MGNKKAIGAICSRNFLCWCLLSLSISSILFAQAGRGAISGLVTDASGAIIPNATVSATNIATGIVATSVSNSSGDYEFPSLRIGVYTVKAEACQKRKGNISYSTCHVADDRVPLLDEFECQMNRV